MTTLEIEALEALDTWFKLQQELNQRVSQSMNKLSRDKYHQKPLNYSLDGDVTCEVKAEKIVSTTKPLKERSGLVNNLDCPQSFANTIDFIFDVANAKIKLTNALRKCNV